MIILGIDPGTRRVGYGVVKKEGNTFSLLETGLLKIESKEDISALEETKRDLDAIINKFKPDGFAIEKVFFAKNRKTGIAVAQARGVLILAAAEKNIPIKEYSPNAIKLALTGYGGADKKAVHKMVKLLLGGLDNIVDDASDALAMAIVAGNDFERDIRFSKSIG